MKKTAALALLFIMLSASVLQAGKLMVPMDDTQNDHLRAYGLAYWVLDELKENVEWLLNYRGGSFMFDSDGRIEKQANLWGITTKPVSDSEYASILATIEEENMEKVLLEKAPKIGVYSPPDEKPWDDAVLLVLDYAKIPHDKFYDREVMADSINKFDWIHLHHEDFTGQLGKFYAAYRNASWYRAEVSRELLEAQKFGFKKSPQLKLAVARKFKQFIADGGFLFAMCSAADTFDIALAADGVDIVAPEIDGDSIDPLAQSKLDYSKSLAFENFKLITNPMIYEYSDIDTSNNYVSEPGTFMLFDFSAKLDPIPTMLNQNHRNVIAGFFGQTTAFRKSLVKSNITILAENNDGVSVKYLRGDYGKGFFCFYGGHDPADVSHLVGEGPTNLALHKNSPGYRLILNNVLFPAAKQKERKT